MTRIDTRLTTATQHFYIVSDDQILKARDQSGISWAVAIRDYLVQETKQEKRLDFSLYDIGQAVSFFNMEDMRYETIFATSKNIENIIANYKRIYRNLIPQCWLVSDKFTHNYGSVVPSGKMLEDVQIKRNGPK